jgi:hypothetical protein
LTIKLCRLERDAVGRDGRSEKVHIKLIPVNEYWTPFRPLGRLSSQRAAVGHLNVSAINYLTLAIEPMLILDNSNRTVIELRVASAGQGYDNGSGWSHYDVRLTEVSQISVRLSALVTNACLLCVS